MVLRESFIQNQLNKNSTVKLDIVSDKYHIVGRIHCTQIAIHESMRENVSHMRIVYVILL